MRRARIKKSAELEVAHYHLISRTVNKEPILDTISKEMLRRLVWQVADACGLEVITYALMIDHFHVLVRVPMRQPVSDDELLRRYAVLYPTPTKYQTAALAVIKSHLASNDAEAVAWRRWMLGLMNDVSQYMKLVKQRFSIWYNHRHGRLGPLWSDRFKSVLVQARGSVVEIMALYIDLNCVRAGLRLDPKDYRFCGYAEAVAGHEHARRGIRAVVGGASWEAAHNAYRQLLFATGGTVRPGRAAIPLDHVKAVLAAKGTLPRSDVLRCRLRYLTDGAVIGTRDFIESHLDAFRKQTGLGTRMAARGLPPITDWGDITTMRACRGTPFG